MKRKQQLLLILGLVLLAALFYAYLATPVQQKAEKMPNRNASRVPSAGEDMAPTAEQKVLLERLQRKGAISAKVKRDIFNFHVKPVVVKKPVVPPRPVVPPPVVKPPPIVRPAPQPPAANLKYLGMLEKEEQQQVFFLGLDNDVVVARIGQPFGQQNQFKLKGFDGENLVVSQGQNRPDLTIRVAERVAVRPGRPAAYRKPVPAAFPSQRDVVPQRPENAPRLKSFKIRDPSVIGR